MEIMTLNVPVEFVHTYLDCPIRSDEPTIENETGADITCRLCRRRINGLKLIVFPAKREELHHTIAKLMRACGLWRVEVTDAVASFQTAPLSEDDAAVFVIEEVRPLRDFVPADERVSESDIRAAFVDDTRCQCCGKRATEFSPRTKLAICRYCYDNCPAPGPTDADRHHVETLTVDDTTSDAAFRDECAMRAMQTLLYVDRKHVGAQTQKAFTEWLASTAYDVADAMVAERSRSIK